MLEDRGAGGHLRAPDQLSAVPAGDLVFARGAEAVGVVDVAPLRRVDRAADPEVRQPLQEDPGDEHVDLPLARRPAEQGPAFSLDSATE